MGTEGGEEVAILPIRRRVEGGQEKDGGGRDGGGGEECDPRERETAGMAVRKIVKKDLAAAESAHRPHNIVEKAKN